MVLGFACKLYKYTVKYNAGLLLLHVKNSIQRNYAKWLGMYSCSPLPYLINGLTKCLKQPNCVFCLQEERNFLQILLGILTY